MAQRSTGIGLVVTEYKVVGLESSPQCQARKFSPQGSVWGLDLREPPRGMDPQGLPGTEAGLEPKSTGASLVLGQAGHLGKYGPKAAGASLVPGSTGTSLALSL